MTDFTRLRAPAILGLLAALLMLYLFGSASTGLDDARFHQVAVKWVHVAGGSAWIGATWYLAFAGQVDDFPLAPSLTLRPLAAMRWLALVTAVSGLLLAKMNNYLLAALTLGAMAGFSNARDVLMGISIWMALGMTACVWLSGSLSAGRVAAPESSEELGSASIDERVFFGLRINAALSLPILVAMVANQTLFGS